jgi:putative hydrolases of HD superfamily
VEASALDRQSALLGAFSEAASLKILPRMGWLYAGVAAPESVAEHSWAVAMLAYLMAAEINLDPASHGLDLPMDLGTLLAIALVHDLGEARLTDLPKRAASLLGKPVKRRAEASALDEILMGVAAQSEMIGLWRHYADASSPEARLVADADKLEMVHQALRYELAGNRGLAEFWDGHSWHYGLSLRLYTDLASVRPR